MAANGEKKGLRISVSVLVSLTATLIAVGGWIATVSMARGQVEANCETLQAQGRTIETHTDALLHHKEEINEKVNSERYETDLGYIKASIEEIKGDVKTLLKKAD